MERRAQTGGFKQKGHTSRAIGLFMANVVGSRMKDLTWVQPASALIKGLCATNDDFLGVP